MSDVITKRCSIDLAQGVYEELLNYQLKALKQTHKKPSLTQIIRESITQYLKREE